MTNPDNAPDNAELEIRMRDTNLTFWLETEALKAGTDNQRARHAENALPEDELLALARGELYQALIPFPRWKNRQLHGRAVTHERTCAGAEQLVTYKTLGGPALPPMDADSYHRLCELRHAVNKISAHEWLTRSHAKVEVDVTRHEATCTRCKRSVVRYAAKVIVPFAGRTLVREYAL